MDSKISVDNYSDYFLDANQSITVTDGEYSCYLCNATYEEDLQLAAELGKTLLERNKELESELRNHQNIIEDQSQEIEYLTKQTAALKEVNSSRFQIYEQLEISIQDLEFANVTLSQQNVADKKQIKSLLETIESLENRCELQCSSHKISAELENQKRQHILNNAVRTENDVREKVKINDGLKVIDNDLVIHCQNCIDISARLEESKTLNSKEQKRIVDFQDQLFLFLEENNYLRDQIENLQKKEAEMKNFGEELSTLEQIRSGNLCKRCLRSTLLTEDYSSADEESIILTNQDNDLEKSISANVDKEKCIFNLQEDAENPYRVLIEKYEALLKIQEQQKQRLKQKGESGCRKTRNCLSLQEELQMTNAYNKKHFRYQHTETDSEIEEENEMVGDCKKGNTASLKSEIGNCDSTENIIHKSVQTDLFATTLPGSFLCKISNGSDCQFSIYDNASPIESRFRKTPEYRQLFREIFDVLKRAAEAKDEGESLPLLDDRLPLALGTRDAYQSQLRVPPVTPAREENSFLYVNEEPCEVPNNAIQMLPENHEKTTETVETVEDDKKPSEEFQQTSTVEKIPRQDTMEQLMEGVKSRLSLKKLERKCISAVHRTSASPSPSHSRSASGKRRAGSKARKKRERFTDSPNRSRERHQQKSDKPVEDGCVSILPVQKNFENENRPLMRKKERPVSMFCFNTGSSSASKEVAKLKILEKSYAEVLRIGRKTSNASSATTGFP